MLYWSSINAIDIRTMGVYIQTYQTIVNRLIKIEGKT